MDTHCSECKSAVPPAAKFCPSCGKAVAPPKLILGDYEVTELIGQGGMGRVYKAIQRRLNRAVCIKTLLPQYAADREISARFAKEAMTTAALTHPNIVSVYDVGATPEGVAYMVMELVDGRPLRHVLRDEAPVSVTRASMLMDQVLAALSEAHTHGVVHRDLKPGNVLVTALRDGREVCKLLDFGIAQVVQNQGEEKLTRAGMMVGTPGYMAPEQIMGEGVDHRADLYAAGAILYELLTGERVFKAASEGELLKKVMLEDPPPPSTRTKEQVPSALDTICLRALARRPQDRFSSAQEFRDALAHGTSVGYGGSSFSGVIEYTPLAAAVPNESSIKTNSRAIVAAALGATDERELRILAKPLERVLKDALDTNDFEVLRSTISVLQREFKEKGPTPHLKLLFEMVRALLLKELPLLLLWLADPEHRAGAIWLLRLVGRGAIGAYLRELSELQPDVQKDLLEVIRASDPDGKLVAAQLKGLDSASFRSLLGLVRSWPDEQCLPVLSAGLQSSDAIVRQAALEGLDEGRAFRLGVVLRQRLHDPAPKVRAEALKWVFRLEDESAVGDLDRLLDRSTITASERLVAWRALGRIKNDASVDLLIKALKTATDLSDVTELVLLLKRSGSDRAIVHLEGLATGPESPRRKAIEQALRSG